MNYILAIFIPPLALFLTRRIGHAIFSILLCVASVAVLLLSLGFGSPIAFGIWVIAVLHSWFVIHGARTDRRVSKAISEAMSSEGK